MDGNKHIHLSVSVAPAMGVFAGLLKQRGFRVTGFGRRRVSSHVNFSGRARDPRRSTV